MAKQNNKSNPNNKATQIALNFDHVVSLSELDFIISKANELAFEHIISFPNWVNPLTLLIGPEKSGKSHLAKIWQEKSNAIIAQNNSLEKLAKQGGMLPVLIEDIDRAGFDEIGIFHLLNQSLRDNRPLLMTARKPVLEWTFKTNDVLSRARLATSFFVQTPDDAQMAQMFAKLFADRQVNVDPKIIHYLIARMERSASEVVSLVDLMDEIALARKKPISLKIASDVLELLRKTQNEQ